MQLKDFIKETLLNISYGIKKAWEVIKKEIGNCPIAPARINGKRIVYNDNKKVITFNINFCYMARISIPAMTILKNKL